ncbi:MAG: 9-O-acetylesterase [Bacteroidetes bacterium]|nr:MAG: 9-O-acetylesterase [Bacteroidota bacterium]
MKKYVLFILAGVMIGCFTPETAPVDTTFRVSRLFSDGMIAQRNATIPVWGYAPPGSNVSVSIGEELREAKAGKDGTWRVELEPRQAGGPFSLSISTGTDVIQVSDIWFGDVWVASGQSNMAWVVANSNDAANEIASADYPLIREFKVPLSLARSEEFELAGGEWNLADSAHVGRFSAVAYYFAKEIAEHVDVPVGIINSTWGGTRVEPWTPPNSFGAEPALAAIDSYMAEADSAYEAVRIKLANLPGRDMGLEAGVAHWAVQDLDTQGWDTVNVPSPWENEGYGGVDGVAWYRLLIELSADQVGDGSGTLGLGRVDDEDITWVNSVEVGRTNLYNSIRAYSIPPGTLHEGPNIIAVRVIDSGGLGGIRGAADDVWLETSSERVGLEGEWRFRFGRADIDEPQLANTLPTVLYNKMIRPLINYPVTGYIWYQGESNASHEQAAEYSELFKSMITGWRTEWRHSDAPFLFVQLANFRAVIDTPSESDWAVLRESQADALSLSNVGQAVIIDIGEANDIHPRNKQDVGLRLALAARHFAYGEEDLVFSGPTYASHRIDGDKIVIQFEHVGGGLAIDEPELGGFAVAGADGKYFWASARIVGTTVVVSSARVREPSSVRYAWADNPDRANLYNAEGLPASPFRTDRDSGSLH